MAITVTATQGGSTANGILLRVKVLTNIAATQNGATKAASGSGGNGDTTITTTTTGSQVYGASVGPNSSATPTSGTTIIDNVADATNGEQYVTWRSTSATGTPGAIDLGATNTGYTGCAMLEVLPNGTITEDSSGPAAASTTSTTHVTSASFTPPAGSLLVALVSSDGGASATTMTVTDSSGLTWTEKIKGNTAGADYVGVWIAFVPAASSGPPQAFRTRLPSAVVAAQAPRRRQGADLVLPAPIGVSPSAFLWDPPRYPQRIAVATNSVRSGRRTATPTGLPAPVQPLTAPTSVRARYTLPPPAAQVPRRRQNADLVITPSTFLWDAPRYTQRIALSVARKRVAPTGWPVPVQPPRTAESRHPRFTRPLLPRRGNVPPTGWPVIIAQTGQGGFGSVTGMRLLPFRRTGETAYARTIYAGPITNNRIHGRVPLPRRSATSSSAFPQASLPLPAPPESLHPRYRTLLPRRGNVAATGWPVPVQPPEASWRIRRWSRPPFPRRGVAISKAPPPVSVNPPISFSQRRWSRPPWPRKGIVAATGYPVPVQPPERLQSVRPRLARWLFPRRSTTENVAPPVMPVTIPYDAPPQRRRRRITIRYGRTVEIPTISPGPISSVQRTGRFRKFSGSRRGTLEVPAVPLPQTSLNPAVYRRKRRFIPFSRGATVPYSGLPVSVQPPERMQFIRRWMRPLLPRRGVIPSSGLPYVAPPVAAVRLPINVSITHVLPRVKIETVILSSTSSFFAIPGEAVPGQIDGAGISQVSAYPFVWITIKIREPNTTQYFGIPGEAIPGQEEV